MSLKLPLRPDIPQTSRSPQAFPAFPGYDNAAINKVAPSRVCLAPSTVQKLEGFAAAQAFQSPFIARSRGRLDTQALVDVLQGSAANGSILGGKSVHGYLLKSNLDYSNSLSLFNHVAKVYWVCSGSEHARRLFEEMPQRDVVSWTVMIVGSTENELYFDGFEFFCDMLDAGIVPDEFVYSSVLQSCIGLDSIELGEGVHGQIVKRGFGINVIVATALLSMYAKLGDVEASIRVFNAIAKHNHVSWSAMISGLTLNGLYFQAFEYFHDMKAHGLLPNMYTFSSVLKAVGKLRDLKKGKEVHHCIRELGMESYTILGTSLIDMYSKCGCLSEAKSVFDRNFIRSKINNPWNAMISAYLQHGQWSEALDLFLEMHLNDIQPDVYTFSSTFSAIAALRWLQFGRQVHGLVIKSSNARYTSVSNAIADAYSKCCSLGDARMVFDHMVQRDVVSWTTLVTAYAQNCKLYDAVDVFFQMREEGFMPNQHTFSSVVVGCASLCLIRFGRQVHGLLCKVGLDTDKCIESSLIIMYAKSDDIISAIKVFQHIVQPDIVSWTAIISSCDQHGLSCKAHELFRKMQSLGVRPNPVNPLMHSMRLKP